MSSDKELFVADAEQFLTQINNSLIEREQIIDSLEILLDRLADHIVANYCGDPDARKVQSLLEVLITSTKINTEADADMARMFDYKVKRNKEN